MRIDFKALAAACLIACIGLGMITWPQAAFFIPKEQKESPWLFKALALWGRRQAEIVWHRGGVPENIPAGTLNRIRYKADWALARSAAKLSPKANYVLAAVWYRFSLTLDGRDVSMWRLTAFLAANSGDLEKARSYIRTALDTFPSHPLILLEKASLLGMYEHPFLHRTWAEQAYNAFEQTSDKSIFDLMDTRMFFLQYVYSLWRGDRSLAQPATRRKIIELYQGLVKYEPIALERSDLYKKAVRLEQEHEKQPRLPLHPPVDKID